MYWAPAGECVLGEAEARLLRYGLELAVHELMEFPEDADSGIQAFDRMTIGQRLTGLGRAAAALLDEGVSMPSITRAIDSSVGAV